MNLSRLCYLGALFLSGMSVAAVACTGREWRSVSGGGNSMWCYQNQVQYWSHPCACPISGEIYDFCDYGRPATYGSCSALAPTCAGCIPSATCNGAPPPLYCSIVVAMPPGGDPTARYGRVWNCNPLPCSGGGACDVAYTCITTAPGKNACGKTFGCTGDENCPP